MEYKFQQKTQGPLEKQITAPSLLYPDFSLEFLIYKLSTHEHQ